MEQVNNIGNNYDDQYEFLFQRSSTLNVLNCHFDVKTGILTLKVKLSQGDNLLPFKFKGIQNQQYLLELKELYKKAKEGQDNDPKKFDEIKKKLYDTANGLLHGDKKIYDTIMKDPNILELGQQKEGVN